MSKPTDTKAPSTLSTILTRATGILAGAGVVAMFTDAEDHVIKAFKTEPSEDRQTMKIRPYRDKENSVDVDLPVTLSTQSPDTLENFQYESFSTCQPTILVADKFGNTMGAAKYGRNDLASANDIPNDGAKDIVTVVFKGCAQEYGEATIHCTSDEHVKLAQSLPDTDLLSKKLFEESATQKFTEENGGECWKINGVQPYSTTHFKVDEHTI